MDEIPRTLKELKLNGVPIKKWSELEWLGENLWQVLQALLEGAHMTYMLRNLERVQPSPARGCEAWFKLSREHRGNTGPRLMRLVKEIFAPVRVKLEQVAGALEAWENHVWQIGPVTKPLLSVGEECDKGKMMLFGRSGGIVLDMLTGTMQRFPRINGQYQHDLWIPPPSLPESYFAGQG